MRDCCIYRDCYRWSCIIYILQFQFLNFNFPYQESVLVKYKKMLYMTNYLAYHDIMQVDNFMHQCYYEKCLQILIVALLTRTVESMSSKSCPTGTLKTALSISAVCIFMTRRITTLINVWGRRWENYYLAYQ